MTRPRTAGEALGGSPLRFLTSSWPWRAWAYVAGSAVVGLLTALAFLVLVAVGVLTSLLVVGVFVLASVPLLAVAVGAVERRRLGLIRPGQPPLVGPSPPLTGSGPRAWWRQRRREPISWRELGHAVLLGTVWWIVDLVVAANAVIILGVLAAAPVLTALGQGPVDMLAWRAETPLEALPIALLGVPIAFVVSAYVVTALAAGQAALARILLGATEEQLEARITELRRSRLELVDAFETERKRIERHLHDGVQHRLVALTMTLGRAELDVPEGPGLELVRQAHREAEAALADLREAVRGIHPRVLVDHGIAAAVREVADRMPIPVTVDLELPERLPAAVEAAAYFMASEAMTNVVRHARAGSCQVTGWVHDDLLVLTVTDDGRGGAEVGAGSGLVGLRTRLDALGGRLTVSSPVGGPTAIRLECPCRLDP